jgi:hypothetical protein
MKQLLLVFSLLFFTNTFSQLPVQLHLKKNGGVKKRIEPGTILTITTKKNDIYQGALLQMKKDSIYFSYVTININDIATIKIPRTKKRMKWDWEEFGYVSLGVALTTAGLVAAKWQEFPKALGTASVIGYSQYAFRGIKSISFKKRRFKIGKKYTLRIWDLR